MKNYFSKFDGLPPPLKTETRVEHPNCGAKLKHICSKDYKIVPHDFFGEICTACFYEVEKTANNEIAKPSKKKKHFSSL